MIRTYTIEELKDMLDVSERTIFRYLDKGWLKGSLRGKWRFTDEDVRAFLNRGRTSNKKKRATKK